MVKCPSNAAISIAGSEFSSTAAVVENSMLKANNIGGGGGDCNTDENYAPVSCFAGENGGR